MPNKPGKPTDMRAYRRRSERQLVIAVVALIVIVGSVVIGLVYGWSSVFTALLCLLPGAGVFVLLWAILNGIEWLNKE